MPLKKDEELLADADVLQLRAPDHFGGPRLRRLARQHLLHQRVVVAQLLREERQAVRQLRDLVAVVNRLLGEEVELQLVQAALAELAQAVGVLLGQLLGRPHQRPRDGEVLGMIARPISQMLVRATTPPEDITFVLHTNRLTNSESVVRAALARAGGLPPGGGPPARWDAS